MAIRHATRRIDEGLADRGEGARHCCELRSIEPHEDGPEEVVAQDVEVTEHLFA